MSDLIDRNAVMLRVREFIGNPTYDEIMLVNDLNALPSAEAERKKGHWIDTDNYYQRWKCSECGCHTRDAEPNYCPNCGTDMRE